MRPFRFVFGSKSFKIPKDKSASLMNLCQKYGITYTELTFEEEYLRLTVPLFSAKRFRSACLAEGIEAESCGERGLPRLIKRYRNRWGIAIGLLAGIIFGAVYSGAVWDIRIDGNLRMSESQVLDILEECGLSEGDRFRKIDTDIVENRVLIASDDISWISINMRGTVANVEIRETDVAELGEELTAANLVAERSGVIEYLEDTRGNVVVDAGQAVSEGELLVGGVYGSETEGFRYTVAKGKVMARTERDFLVKTELQYQKKTYTGRSKVEKYLIFFEKEIKFYGNSGNSYASCDTIDTVEYFHSFGGAELPVGIRTVRYMEYEYTDATRSADEAAELAYYTLRCQMEAELADAELLSKRLEFEIGEEAYILKCHVSVIEDIAVVKKIDVDIFKR